MVIKTNIIELKTHKNIYDQTKFGMFSYWYWYWYCVLFFVL